jgi:hypothetical protein
MHSIVAKLAILFLASWTSLAAQQLVFSGSVRADQPFTRSLGRGLVLVVTTSEIGVQHSPYPPDGNNYAQCVTPPAHGPNPIYLDAWLFDPTRNPDPNPRLRSFQFTVNAVDDKAACENLNAILHNPPPGKGGTFASGIPRYIPPPLGSGSILISNLQLSDPSEGKDAEIASFDFIAKVTLPQARNVKRSAHNPKP